MKPRYWMALAAVLAVAGCTSFPTGGGTASGKPPASGLVIQEASLQNTAIPTGGDTELVLRVANTQPGAVTGVHIAVTNTGGLKISKDSDQSDPTCPEAGGTVKRIAGATQGVPTQLLCVWDVNETEDGGARPATYPVTVTVTYVNSLTMQKESPKITFDPDQQIAAAKSSRTFSNGELSLAVTYPPTLPAGAKRIEVKTTAANPGNGDIVGISSVQCDGRCVDLRYSGSLLSGAGYTASGDRCGIIRFLQGEQEATSTCTFTDGSTADTITTHNLRMKATYGYQLHRELPLTVVKD